MKFILKWLINGVIVVALLMYYADVSFINAAITATIITLIAYFVGDRFILRSTNNVIATISDFALAFLILWIVGNQMNWAALSITEILFISLLLGVAEWVLHRYVFDANLSTER